MHTHEIGGIKKELKKKERGRDMTCIKIKWKYSSRCKEKYKDCHAQKWN